jgi:hypothetical protein
MLLSLLSDIDAAAANQVCGMLLADLSELLERCPRMLVMRVKRVGNF